MAPARRGGRRGGSSGGRWWAAIPPRARLLAAVLGLMGTMYAAGVVLLDRNALAAQRTRNLPRFAGGEGQCTVCLEDLSCGGSPTSTRLACGHGFHVECVATWVERAGTCPLCRRNFTRPGWGVSRAALDK